MAGDLKTNEIRTILAGGGLITFGSAVAAGTKMLRDGIDDAIVENNYVKTMLTVDVAGGTISMSRVANETTGKATNAVNIRTIDAKATTGSITTPGYIYTGDFSGCIFYLYQSGSGEIIGVHAYNGAQPVESRTKYLRRKLCKMVVREYGPMDYFNRNPARMICRYPTSGQMDISLGEQSLGFLSCVDRTTATTFLFGVKGSAAGSRVTRLIQTYHVKY